MDGRGLSPRETGHQMTSHRMSTLREIEHFFFLFTIPIYYSLVPVLSMLIYFLWLAYRKYEYKYTIIRWKWYIVIRIFLIYLIETNIIIIPRDYQLI